jgi:alkylation response protein AidB-like acyl-CoA dehydrogenase
MLRAVGDEIEQTRHLPLHVVRAMQDAGIFRMAMPTAWGGPCADINTQIRIVEELSIADGSAGWCAMIGADGGYFTAFLEDSVGRALYPDMDIVTAAMTMPAGVARREGDGFRVNGRWPFASGCQHSTWLVANCRVERDGDFAKRPDGSPETRMVFLPMTECIVHDTWTTTGLRGTGSNDVEATNLLIPYEHTFDPLTAPITQSEPLYQWRGMYVANGAGVPLGIARAAIDAMVEISAGKVTRAGTGLQREAYVQSAVARAESLLGAARAYVYDVMGDVWDSLVAGRPLTKRQRAAFRLCLAGSCELTVQAVDLMYHVAGGSSLYARSPLDRHFRDIHTVHQHIANLPKVYEIAGQLYLGMEPGLPGW